MAFEMIKAIPVDQSSMNLQALGVLAKADRDGVQRTNRDDVNLWAVQCVGKHEDGGLFTLEVQVASEKSPAVQGPVEFKNLVVKPWSIDGRSGLSVTADSVQARTVAPAQSQVQTQAPAAR